MKNKQIVDRGGRRKFLRNAGKGVTGALVASNMVGSVVSAAENKPKPPTTQHLSKTLLRMSLDIYPHDMVDKKYYQQVVNNVIKDHSDLMISGVIKLDADSNKRLGKDFALVDYEPDRVRLMRSIEASPFFTKLRTQLMFGIYNNKELFPLFGYGGSSVDKGGYLNRGLNVVDWLDK